MNSSTSYRVNKIKDSWHYKTTEEKKQAVIDTVLYECHEDVGRVVRYGGKIRCFKIEVLD